MCSLSSGSRWSLAVPVSRACSDLLDTGYCLTSGRISTEGSGSFSCLLHGLLILFNLFSALVFSLLEAPPECTVIADYVLLFQDKAPRIFLPGHQSTNGGLLSGSNFHAPALCLCFSYGASHFWAPWCLHAFVLMSSLSPFSALLTVVQMEDTPPPKLPKK